MREILMMNNQMFTPSIRVMLSTLNNPLTKFDNKTLLHNIGRNKFMEVRYYEKYGGGKIWQKIKRFGKRVYVFEISKQEGLEILSLDDWMIAESVLNRRNILIRLEGYKEIGMGHIYRGLQLASALFEHNVFFAVSEKSRLAVEKITERGYECHVIKSNKEVPIIQATNPKIDVEKIFLQTEMESVCNNEIISELISLTGMILFGLPIYRSWFYRHNTICHKTKTKQIQSSITKK